MGERTPRTGEVTGSIPVRSTMKSLPRMLTLEEIRTLRDEDLLKWARKLKWANNQGRFGEYPNPKQATWCHYEARRELT